MSVESSNLILNLANQPGSRQPAPKLEMNLKSPQTTATDKLGRAKLKHFCEWEANIALLSGEGKSIFKTSFRHTEQTSKSSSHSITNKKRVLC